MKKNVSNGTSRFKYVISQMSILLALLIICIVIIVASNGKFILKDNIFNILKQMSTSGILALGMTLVIITGGIDLSVGSIMAFAGIIGVSVFASGGGLFVAIIAALAVGTVIGIINGAFVALLHLTPFIVTLANMTIFRGLTYYYSDGKPINIHNEVFLYIGKGDFIGIPIIVWIFIVVLLISAVIMNYTKVGKYIYAVGGNEKAAKLTGIKISKVKLFVYAYCGLLAGLTSIVLSSRITAALPQAGSGYELDVIASVVIGGTSLSGGKGKLWRTTVGVLIIGVISNGMDLLGASYYLQQVIKGLIILIAIIVDKLTYSVNKDDVSIER